MAADDPRDGHNDWRPIPDPTTLTTEQLRRELSALREILTARLDGMDRATALLDETVNRTPTQIQTEISHVRELLQEKLGSLSGQTEEKFKSIAQQFSERDVRTDQAATASASALAAALQAAKEAVFEQAQAAAKAAEKTELSFTKQIDQIQLQIKTIGDGFSDRIAELKERIDRGEGQGEGQDRAIGTPYDAAVYRQSAQEAKAAAEQARAARSHEVTALVISAFLVVVTLASVIFAIVKK